MLIWSVYGQRGGGTDVLYLWFDGSYRGEVTQMRGVRNTGLDLVYNNAEGK